MSTLSTRIAAILVLFAVCAVANDGSLIVLNKSDATALVLSAADGSPRATLPTGAGPHEVAVSRDGTRAVVSDYGRATAGSTLTVLDLEDLDVERTIDLGEHRHPHGIVFLDERSRVLVTVEDSEACIIVDVDDGEVVATLPTGQAGSHMVAVTPDAGRAFVANITAGTLSVLDVASGANLATIETAPGCEGVAVTPDGRRVWTTNRAAHSISVVDADSLEVVDTVSSGGRFPIRVEFTPDGARALVSNAASGDVAVFDVATRELVAKIPMRVTPREDLDGRVFAKTFADTPVPIGLLVHPDGTRAFVANTHADMVTVIDLDSLAIVDRLATGREPDGLGWTPREYPPER